ncbi:hypothetical protein [Streptomyces sp. NPDC054786]
MDFRSGGMQNMLASQAAVLAELMCGRRLLQRHPLKLGAHRSGGEETRGLP